MADATQTDVFSRQYNWSEGYGVSENSFKWKPKTCREVILFSM